MFTRYARLWSALVLVPISCAPFSTRRDEAAIFTEVKERTAVTIPEPPAVATDDAPARDDLPRHPLGRAEAVALALARNRAARAELAAVGIARGELLQAGVVANPVVELAARIPTSGRRDVHWEASARFDLSDLILRKNRVDAGTAELAAARAHAAGALVRFIYTVEVAYARRQAAAQKRALWESARANSEASYTTARVLFDAGNLPALDVTSQEAMLAQTRIFASEAALAEVDAAEALTETLGLPQSSDVAIEETLDESLPALPSAEAGEATALERSFVLAEMRYRMRRLAAEVGLARTSSWLPDLSLGVSAESDGSAWTVGPLFHGSLPLSPQSRGVERGLTAQLEALRGRYVQKGIAIRAAVRRLQKRVASSQRRVEQYQQSLLPLRDKIVAESLLQYNAMQLGVFQLLEARRQQLETRRLYLDALVEYWLARAALDTLLAGELVDTQPLPGSSE